MKSPRASIRPWAHAATAPRIAATAASGGTRLVAGDRKGGEVGAEPGDARRAARGMKPARPLNLTYREGLPSSSVTAMTGQFEQTSGLMRIGALADATGVSVRALHHYDAIGLLTPAERTQSGHRLYSEANVRRLYRIAALRRLGLSLDEIVEILDRDPDLAGAIRRHLAQVEQSLELQRRLHRTLGRMLELLESGHEPTLDEFIEAIEVMTVIGKYYTSEQQAQLEERRSELGTEGMRKAERDWAELIEAVKREQAGGTAPTDARMLELAARWRALIEQFTGGDDAIEQSLATMYREEGPQAASRGMVDPELMQYVAEALAALR